MDWTGEDKKAGGIKDNLKVSDLTQKLRKVAMLTLRYLQGTKVETAIKGSVVGEE